MPRGMRVELEPKEVELIMEALFAHETSDEAFELHNKLTICASRTHPDWTWTITAFRVDGKDAV